VLTKYIHRANAIKLFCHVDSQVKASSLYSSSLHSYYLDKHHCMMPGRLCLTVVSLAVHLPPEAAWICDHSCQDRTHHHVDIPVHNLTLIEFNYYAPLIFYTP